MVTLLKGETVLVQTRTKTGVDAFNSPIYTTSEVSVANVLVSPSTPADNISAMHPEGVRVKYMLHFPKSYTGNLQGLKIRVRGSLYDVIGSPDHYTLENTPGEWWLPVEVGDTSG